MFEDEALSLLPLSSSLCEPTINKWQHTTHEGNRNNGTALPAPNLADRTSEMSPFSRKRPINAVKHQHKSTQYKPQPNRCANSNVQHLNGHPKPKICLPRWHRLPLEGERVGGAANGYTRSLSGHSMPQKLGASPNKLDTLVTLSIELENPDSGEILQVRLASVHWHMDNVNCLGNGANASTG